MVTGGAVSGRDARGRHLHLRPEKDRALLIVDGVKVIVLNREAAASGKGGGGGGCACACAGGGR
jgi:hypothetical protein